MTIITFVNVKMYACSCIGESTVEVEYSHSDLVFSGTVIAVRDSLVTPLMIFKDNILPFRKFVFEVDSVYKGKMPSDSIIRTGFGNGDCGFHFLKGEKYIVYSKGNRTNICTRTMKYPNCIFNLPLLPTRFSFQRIDQANKSAKNFHIVATFLGVYG